MRSLVTGVDGFIGSWLAEALAAAGDTVLGTTRRASDSAAHVTKYPCEMTDTERVGQVVRETSPDRIFHLAAVNNLARSFADPRTTFDINLGGMANVLEAARRYVPGACLVSVGSSAEYGKTSALATRLEESDPLAPTSPYGVSKAAQGQLSAVYAQAYGLRTAHVRPFAVVGPRKRGDVLSDFCRGIVAIERGAASELRVGNLEAVRDFVDVRDCASALITISKECPPGALVNLCTGNEVSLHQLLEVLRGLSTCKVDVKVDAARNRVTDDLRIVGNPSRLLALGHVPKYSLRETLDLTLNSWRG
jgi:GDP-4-dehydro-6-deoxy-D-mannose reductase